MASTHVRGNYAMATTHTKPRPITAEELLKLHSEGVRGELIRGVLCETMPPGLDHAAIVANLTGMLWAFLQTSRIGRVFSGDPGIWIERGPDTVRAPDIAYYAAERMASGVSVPGYAEIVPDLAIEVASPSQSVAEVNDKARMWIDAGVRLVWIVWPRWGTVEILRPDEDVVELSGDALLEGQDVLPGFSTAVSEIFSS